MALYSLTQTLRVLRTPVLAFGALLIGTTAGAQETPAKAPMAKLTQAPPGRVIFEFGSKPKAPVSAAVSAPAGANGVASANGGAISNTTQAAPADTGKLSFMDSLPPPSGRSLNSARRLDAPDQGVVIKDAPKVAK